MAASKQSPRPASNVKRTLWGGDARLKAVQVVKEQSTSRRIFTAQCCFRRVVQ